MSQEHPKKPEEQEVISLDDAEPKQMPTSKKDVRKEDQPNIAKSELYNHIVFQKLYKCATALYNLFC